MIITGVNNTKCHKNVQYAGKQYEMQDSNFNIQITNLNLNSNSPIRSIKA